LQSKEKKWSQVEDILEEIGIDNENLIEKLKEIRLEVSPRIRLTNVVEINERY